MVDVPSYLGSQRCYSLFFLTVSGFFLVICLVLVCLFPSGAGRSCFNDSSGVIGEGRLRVVALEPEALLLFDRVRSLKHFVVLLHPRSDSFFRLFPSASCSLPPGFSMVFLELVW